jgi:Zn-dependent metalloprotease
MLRGERGQASTTYAGILAIVAVVFGVLFALNLDGKVRSTAEQALCTIFSGTDCGEPQARASGYADDEYDDSGRGDREVFDDRCGGDTPDDPARAEGDTETGDDQVDQAYINLGRVYDYYADRFGHDSYDGDGAPVTGVVNFCRVAGYDTGVSSFNGEDVNFAPGAGDALDTAAHEFTHGVTAATAGLRYECQSGALNESISDIMAWNLDPEDTTYGEDRNSGVARDYANPELHGQPGHVDDYNPQPNTDDGDHGGVHENSGIPNHAYYLIVKRIGRAKAEQIVWRSLTEHLEPDSDFEDFRTAMLESARELYGEGDVVDGVNRSFADVGLDGSWEAPEQEGC